MKKELTEVSFKEIVDKIKDRIPPDNKWRKYKIITWFQRTESGEDLMVDIELIKEIEG